MALNRPKESKVMYYVNLAGHGIMLNLMFLLSCIPIVTIGPAFSGLYSGVRYMIRGDGCARGFWEGFKTNFLRTMLAGLVCTGVIGYFIFKFNQAFNLCFNENLEFIPGSNFLPMITYGVSSVPFLMIIFSLWPLNIYIPYNTVDWLKNAVNLCFKAPHWVLLTAVLMIAPVAIFLWVPPIFWMIAMLFIAIYYAVACFVSTLFLKDALVVFKHAYEEQEETEETDV